MERLTVASVDESARLEELSPLEIDVVSGGSFKLGASGSGSYSDDVQNLGFYEGTKYYLQRTGWI